MDIEITRTKYNIPECKKNIISFGCQSLTDERKGMSYMIDALNIIYDRMTDEERKNTIILSIGNDGEKIEKLLRLDYKWLGYISIELLPEFYSISNVFVCSSVNDAGPSMLKQSLSCGTPLVACEMWAALDLLVGLDTGFCVKLRGADGLAEGVLKILRMPADEYTSLRSHCRNYVLESNSEDAFVRQVLSVLN